MRGRKERHYAVLSSKRQIELRIEELQTDIRTIWFGLDDNDLYTAVALAGETGKVCNFIKKENRINAKRWDYQEDIEKEIIDILFYVLALADQRKVDIEEVWHSKMNHNEKKYNRPITKRPFICDCAECFEYEVQNIRQTPKGEWEK